MSQETERYQLENNGNTYLVRTTAGGGGTEVVANPEGEATTDLTKLQVDDTIYGIPEGTEVVANPTLAGTESALTGLQVGDTKYAVVSGMTNPMTAVGDLIYGGISGNPTRLSNQAVTDGHRYLHYQSLTNSPEWGNITPSELYHTANNQVKTPYVSSNTAVFNMLLGKPAQDFGLGYTTTAPTANNTDGLKFVVLTAEPATYYDGYYYIIAPSTP